MPDTLTRAVGASDADAVRRALIDVEEGRADSYDPDSVHLALVWAVDTDRPDVVAHVLNSEHLEVEDHLLTAGLALAIRAGNSACVDLFLEDGRANATGHQCVSAVSDAARVHRNSAVVSSVLDHPGFIVTTREYEKIATSAVLSGDIDTVAAVLRDLRSFQIDGAILAIIIERGHDRVFHAVMDDGRVDVNGPTTLGISGGKPLKTAARLGRAAVVERLLADPRIQPGCARSGALRAAAGPRTREHPRSENHAVVELLLADSLARERAAFDGPPGVCPDAVDSEALVAAVDRGCVRTVELLLDDARVRTAEGLRPGVSAMHNRCLALRRAVKHLCAEADDGPVGRAARRAVVELLLETRRWGPAIARDGLKRGCFHVAVFARDPEAVQLLIDCMGPELTRQVLGGCDWRRMLRGAAPLPRPRASKDAMIALLEAAEQKRAPE